MYRNTINLQNVCTQSARRDVMREVTVAVTSLVTAAYCFFGSSKNIKWFLQNPKNKFQWRSMDTWRSATKVNLPPRHPYKFFK